MQINWFTVVAQVINFFILVWLLKRFLYKPILKAIDERENKITAQLNDAKAKETEANKERDEFQVKNQTFDSQKKELLSKAITETKAERDKLMEEVRADAGTLRTKLEKAFNDTQTDKERTLLQKAQQEVFGVARKTLTDLASAGLEENAVLIFLKRLNDLTEEEKKKLKDAFKSDPKPIQVRSAFDLPEKQQTDIMDTIAKMLGEETKFQFITAAELVSGIELTANGYKVAWSIAAYLNALEKRISEMITTEKEKEPEKV
jgi:F-type H+-transporting ATPase subunit b